jgi:predicted transcriptional regulator
MLFYLVSDKRNIKCVLIGKRLRYFRKKAGYNNYEDFCWDNDIPTRTYFRMERGENFTMQNLIKVLTALDVELNDFFKEL